MKKFLRKILLVSIGMVSFSISAGPMWYRHTTSSCALINPPNSSVRWDFYGNQAVYVTVRNGNVLGVTVSVNCKKNGKSDNFILGPFMTSSEQVYDIFGQVPIAWMFEVSTISSAAAVYCDARWMAFQYDYEF